MVLVANTDTIDVREQIILLDIAGALHFRTQRAEQFPGDARDTLTIQRLNELEEFVRNLPERDWRLRVLAAMGRVTDGSNVLSAEHGSIFSLDRVGYQGADQFTVDEWLTEAVLETVALLSTKVL